MWKNDLTKENINQKDYFIMQLWWKWIKIIPLMLGSLSVISVLTLLKRMDLFKRILSDTNRYFYKAWGNCLPAITPKEITKNNNSASVIFDRGRASIGIDELIPILELLQLSKAHKILEIGTSSGGTTWHLAANAGKEASIFTVDLPPHYSHIKYSSNKLATMRATGDKLGMLFRGTPESERITQILVDSKDILKELGDNKFDFIFIDGAHTYEYVKNDTQNALKLIKDGGYIVWHDYFVFYPDFGVFDYLRELNKKLPVYQLCNSLCGVAKVNS